MADLSRRDFLRGGAKPPMTYREGGHGDRISLLGFGMMRLPTVDGKHANGWAEGVSDQPIDQDLVNREVDYALEHGVNYFDTSPVYCRGESERVLGIALARHPRASYFVATKASNFAEELWPLAKSQAQFEQSFKDLRVEVIDYYLLHSIGNGGFETFSKRYLENGFLDWLAAQRAQGRIRNLGFSYHGDERAFHWCMEHHDKYHWDFVQIQLNYVDWKHAKEVNERNLNGEYLYAELAQRNIPAVVMEPLLGGRLARFDQTLAAKLVPLDPEASLAKWALRFAGHWPKIMTVLSGMTRLEHVEENCATYSPLQPLSAKELATLEEAAQLYLAGKTIPCTECQYCMPCPYGLDIPGIFSVWNTAVANGTLPDDAKSPGYAEKRQAFLRAYARRIPQLRRADHCVTCGRCAPHCPQSIKIPEEMTMIDSFVEILKRGVPAPGGAK